MNPLPTPEVSAPTGHAPRVSIAMLTFNHEDFLAQAIESVLEQAFDDWELVIGEDCSTDRTLDIARHYAKLEPERIRLLETPQNLGVLNNYLRTFGACRGEYLAQLDGDDYWTANDKLSRQVCFLDDHPDASLVFCACEMLGEDGSGSSVMFRPPGRLERYEQTDLLWGNLMSSCAVLWRRPEFDVFPGWFHQIPSRDWAVHLLVSENGWMGYEDWVACTHRTHTGGIWAGLGNLSRLEQRIETRSFLSSHLGDVAAPIAQAADLRDRFRIARELGRLGRHREALDGYRWCLHHRMNGYKPHPGRSILGMARSRLALALSADGNVAEA